MRKQRHGRSVPALSLMMALMIFSVGGTVFAGAALWPHAAHAAAVAGADGKRPPGGDFANPAVRALDIAQPAMVRVGNFVPASITIGLCTRTVRLPLGGGTYKVGVTGSGAFISANGDVLTADHVVDVSKADWDYLTIQYAAQDIADLFNNASHYDPGCQASSYITADEIASGAVSFSYTTHIGDQTRVVWRSVGYSGVVSGTHLLEVAHDTATVTASSSFDQNDVAILHVNETDTPSISLDDSSNVAVADHLTVLGFPGNADLTDPVTGEANVDNELITSANDVYVSAIKLAGDGSSLIEVGGNVEHGDSGGPALDAAGRVVGVVSFGGVADPRGLTTFLRSSNDALTLVNEQGIAQRPGAFERAWTKAFDDYAATYPGHWHAAASEMDRLATTYPAFQGIAPYKVYADAAAATETVPETGGLPGGLTLIALLVGAAVVVLLLVGGAVWVVVARRRRRARKAAASGAPPTGMYGAPGGMPGYPPGYGPPGPAGAPPGYPAGYYGPAPVPSYGAPPYPYGMPPGPGGATPAPMPPAGAMPGAMPAPVPVAVPADAGDPSRDQARSGGSENVDATQAPRAPW